MRNSWNLADPLIIDRAAEARDAVDLDAAHAVVVREGSLLVREDRLVLLAPGDRPPHDLVVFLGRDGDREIVAVVPQDAASDELAEMMPLRELLGRSVSRGPAGARDRELASTAVAITAWHQHHRHCSTCGAATTPTRGGWVRHCADCGRDHYPRTDPAIIVAITDPEDRLLMAHAAYWSPKRFSHLAGYVEPGESLEQAVHREVQEEAGITLASLDYVASQPWPFPASVMVGFRATVDSPELRLDQEEITEAFWVTRPELGALVADGSVVIAPAGSIARNLLEEWYGSALE